MRYFLEFGVNFLLPHFLADTKNNTLLTWKDSLTIRPFSNMSHRYRVSELFIAAVRSTDPQFCCENLPSHLLKEERRCLWLYLSCVKDGLREIIM